MKDIYVEVSIRQVARDQLDKVQNAIKNCRVFEFNQNPHYCEDNETVYVSSYGDLCHETATTEIEQFQYNIANDLSCLIGTAGVVIGVHVHYLVRHVRKIIKSIEYLSSLVTGLEGFDLSGLVTANAFFQKQLDNLTYKEN
jgi:hypothetical protein